MGPMSEDTDIGSACRAGASSGEPLKRSYSLAEVAAAHLPEDWTDSERWLRRRLNSGELTGFRVGRVWRMTDSDVEHLLNRGRKARPLVRSETPTEVTDFGGELSFWEGMSEGSRRRRRLRS